MTFGKLIILLGALIILIGIIYEFTSFFSIFKNNPLDFKFNIGNTNIYIPLGTCLIISVFLTILMKLF